MRVCVCAREVWQTITSANQQPFGPKFAAMSKGEIKNQLVLLAVKNFYHIIGTPSSGPVRAL